MNATVQFATLVITTMFAAVAAVALHWLCLRAAFLMMRPATARRTVQGATTKRSTEGATAKRSTVGTELARGTAQLARAYARER